MTSMTTQRSDRSRRLSARLSARHIVASAGALVLALTLQACGPSDSDYDFDASRMAYQTEQAESAAALSAPATVFDPGAGRIPFPNDLLFGADGTLDVPVTLGADGQPANPADPLISLNQLDGFSTTAPVSAAATEALAAGTVTLGSTVRVFRVDASPQGAISSVDGELGPEDVVAQAIGSQIVIVPIRPLAPATRYLVVLTNGILGEDEQALTASLFYGLAKNPEPYTQGLAEFEPVRQLTQTHLAAATSQDIDPADVVLSWTFRTQSTREPIQAAADIVTPMPLLLAPAPGPDGGPLSTSDANELLQGKADIWIGTLDLPYYQTAADADDAATSVAAISGFWRNANGDAVNPVDWVPQATGTVTVPVLMSVPNAASAGGAQAPDGGWPVTVFQHGITQDRSNLLALADTMADAGRVVIGIDLPMHGIVEPGNPLNATNTPFDEAERHFGIDLAGDDPMVPGPDGAVDSSGTWFYTLTNLANSRDNLRQATADLLALSASLPSALVPDGAGGGVPAAEAGLPLNTDQKNFIGHSLGGIVGTTTLAFDSSYQSASLVNPGGGIANLLLASEVYGPGIVAGLAAAGIVQGTPEFASFFVAVQSVLDSADPISHAPALAEDASTGLHMVQVDGDDSVPNAVEGAPLSGTVPLAAALQLPQIAETTGGNRHFVRFSVGNHGTLLGRAEGEQELAATVEMQRQVASFAVSAGQSLPINDSSVITPVEQP